MILMIKTDPPAAALHQRFAPEDGFYRDCYEVEVEQACTLPQFVEAFYTSALFKVERAILKRAAKRPSTDAQAHQLANGQMSQFAAWDVEDRTETQLLLRDMTGATYSWFMVEPLEGGTTRLRFGSVVAPRPGTKKMPRLMKPLMRFHDLYSKMLLKAAVKRLAKVHI